MTNEDIKSIAQKWITAFNLHDIELLLELYDENAKHYSPRFEEQQPKTNGWLIGKEQLRAWWQGSFSTLKDLNYQLLDLTVENNKVFMRYKRKANGQKDSEVMKYLKVENGLIIESRVLRSWLINQSQKTI
jgi:ketosteroid isomerase-like protein